MKPGEHRGHLQLGEYKRRFLYHVPSCYNGHSPLPIVLMFHGAGGTARWTRMETGWNEQADKVGFLIVYPEGLPLHPGKVAQFLHNPPSWNDGSPYWSQHDDLYFIEQLLAYLPSRVAIDPQRIYVTGFSNGAGFAFQVAYHFANQVAALAPVAGHCWLNHPHGIRPIPTFYMVGTMDPLIPLAGGEVDSPWGFRMKKPSVDQSLKTWAKILGCDPHPQRSESGDGIEKFQFRGKNHEEMITYWLLQGHGHHWPGGRGEFTTNLAGPNSSTLKATEVIWRFFERYVLA